MAKVIIINNKSINNTFPKQALDSNYQKHGFPFSKFYTAQITKTMNNTIPIIHTHTRFKVGI